MPRLKIAYKLILAVAMVTALMLGLFSWMIFTTHRKELLHQVEQTADQLSETIKSSTKYYMLRNNREDLHRVVDTLASQKGIERIRVFNKEGQIKFSSNREEINSVVDTNAEACYACHAKNAPLSQLPMRERTRVFISKNGTRTLGVINPIYNEPRCSSYDCHAHRADQSVLGVFDITMSLEEVDSQLDRGRVDLLRFAVIVIVIISILLWFLVQRLVGRPVALLVDATNRVAEGDLSLPIVPKSNDELGNLAQSFNTMTSKLENAQRQIYQQDRLASLGRLSAGVAHELNNPLTGILSFSSFLLRDKDLKQEARADIEVIVRETKRCRDIVKSLLDFTRQTPSKKQSVDLNSVVEKALKILDNQIQLAKVTILKSLSPSLTPVWGDPGQLQQVVINLVVNALDAMAPTGGVLEIETSHSNDGRILLLVKDSGCGIREEDIEHIFEPFFSTKGLSGTGLGLSVVWGIVEDHCGKIRVNSKLGEGSTFTVELPSAHSN